MTEDEIDRSHHQLNGHEFEQASGDGEGQGSLACCNLWGHKESDLTEQLSNSINIVLINGISHLHVVKPITNSQFYFFICI